MWNYLVTTFKKTSWSYMRLYSTQSVGNYTKPALLHYRKVLPGERYKETLEKQARVCCQHINNEKKNKNNKTTKLL